MREPQSQREPEKAKRIRKYTRGMPPPATFSLSALPDDGRLKQQEVAAVERKSVVAVEKGRINGTDNLEWVYLDGGYPRCIVGSLKKKMARTGERRQPMIPQRLGALNAR